MFGGMRGSFLQGKGQGDLGLLRDSRSTQSAQGLGNAPRDWGEPSTTSSSWKAGGGTKLSSSDSVSWGTPTELPSYIDTTNEDLVSTVTPDDVTMQDSDNTQGQQRQTQKQQSQVSDTGAAIDAAVSGTSTMQSIPLRKSFTPLYPHMTTNVPKSALHALFGKAPRRCSLSGDLYHTWHDSGPPHTLMWTSLFVCPITAEFFLATVYKGISERTDAYQEKNGLVWFKKKANAEHGAAARAFDCWQYRDLVAADPSIPPHCTLVVDLPKNMPYPFSAGFTGSSNNRNLPESIPESIQQKVEEQRAEILQTRSVPMQTEEEEPTEEEEEPTEMAWQSQPPSHVVDEDDRMTSGATVAHSQTDHAGDDSNVDNVFADA